VTGFADREDGRVPKLCGADIELGNFVMRETPGLGSGGEAARALLVEFDGVSAPDRFVGSFRLAPPSRRGTTGRGRGFHFDPQDWGRKFLPSNGGCVYIDLEHLELCLPEVLSAFDHAACWHAMLSLTQDALASANARRDEPIEVLVNNSDGQGNSYGSHLNFLVSRRTWEHLIHRRPHHLAWLAAFQASLLVLTGQGKVGSENGRPRVSFQLSQRADFLETLLGIQTTYRRPLINTRDEPLCGATDAGGLARLHVICFDSTLCPVASLLKVGAMQIALAMLEAGAVDLDLALEDPLDAAAAWSGDATLSADAPLASGATVTALGLQRRFADQAARFVARGECEGLVPRAVEIVALWQDTLDQLARGDWAGAARRLDWVLKLGLIERALNARPDLDWSSPEVKVLDHRYAALDPQSGLFWACAAAGAVEPVIESGQIERFRREPPEDTRAWGRAMWLRTIPASCIDDVDWDAIRFRVPGGTRSRRSWPAEITLENPLRSTRAELESLFNDSQGPETLARASARTVATRRSPGGNHGRA
jgi:proteasome accessory factor A